MKGKKLLFLLIAVFVLAAGAANATAKASPSDAVNLAVNESFEDTDAGTGLPLGWSTDAWLQGADDTAFTVETEGAKSGRNCVRIVNNVANDARFIQTIEVEPDALYRLSAYIKASGVPEDGVGASFGVMDMQGSLLDIDETFGKWQKFEFYGRTGKDQTQMTVALRLGGYGNVTTGSAWFDEVRVEPVGELPEGVVPVSLESDYREPGEGEDTKTQQQLIEKPQAYASLILVSLLYLLFYYALVHRFFKKPAPLQPEQGLKKSNLTYSFIIALTAALLIRLLLAALSEGFPTDIACFRGWADHLARTGPWNFYDGSIFADYPPGYMYVLLALGWIRDIFGIAADSALFTLIIKLPSIFADIALAYFVYALVSRRAGTRLAFALSMLVAFNPASVLVTSLWGQIDAILALLLVLCAHSLYEKKHLKACLIYAAVLLIKPQALLFGPVILFAFVYDWMKANDRKSELKKMARGVGAAVLLFVAAIVPFWGGQGPLWIFDRYLSTATSYAYASVNAFNLFGLLGANWAADSGTFLLFSYKVWGFFLIGCVVVASAVFFFKKPDRKKLYIVAAFVFAGVFTLAHNMHERYLFPAIPLLVMAYIELRDKRVLACAAGFTVTLLFNAGTVLSLGNIPADDIVLRLASGVQVLLFAYFAWVCYDVCVRGRTSAFKTAEEEAPASAREKIASVRAQKLGWKRKDTLLAGGLTLVYAVIALVNLGTTAVPQTYWRAQQDGAAAEIRFDGVQDVASMRYYGGIADGSATVELVDDAGDGVASATLDQVESSMYTWVTLDISGEASGAVIRADTPEIWLLETAFFDANGDMLPVKGAASLPGESPFGPGSAPSHLTDEQDRIPKLPTHMDEMYFDEIYHARTAYEHLNGMEFYETTHPPLGKLFIAAGVGMFGMNPFGWRIVGTVFGILMVPIMYVFGKRLFGRTRYAFIAAFLLAFDCMHFVQTRIATIDVYGVFFIILMFYEMYRYHTASFYDQPLRSTLKPLLFCGIFFGLGVASKWIGLYSGAGLAFLFFLTLYNRLREKRLAEAALEAGADDPDGYLKRVLHAFGPATIRTLIAAAAFFIVIPLAIYVASYVPILLAREGNYTLGSLWEFQTFMFNYHSFLTATHPFSSQWWSWPFNVRPIWYYAGSGLPAGKAASIAAFGNIAVWWGGLISSVWLMVTSAKRRIGADPGKLVVLVALASGFLPWVLVTRATFIYHYFACVPFIILAAVYLIRYLEKRFPRFKYAVLGYLILVAAVFAFFYPAMSGMTVPAWYAHLQELLPSWGFYLQ